MKDEYIHFDNFVEAKTKCDQLLKKTGVYSATISIVVDSSDYDKGTFIVNWSEDERETV